MYIRAKYPGLCAHCGASFKRGENVYWNRGTKQVTRCNACRSHDQAGDYSDRAYEDKCAAACGLDSLSFRD